MGKAARERARRAAETPKLILPPAAPVQTMEPRTSAEAETTPHKLPQLCRVQGCPRLALERHEGPDGVVWLCGNCGHVARHNLLMGEYRERFAEAVAQMHVPAMKHYERQRQRIYGRKTPRPVLLGSP